MKSADYNFLSPVFYVCGLNMFIFYVMFYGSFLSSNVFDSQQLNMHRCGLHAYLFCYTKHIFEHNIHVKV